MKLTRIAGAGAVAALVAASTLLTAGAAQAADTYVTIDQIGVEGESYPAGWFAGDVSAPAGTVAVGVGGLAITGGTGGGYQLLNGTPGIGDLVALASEGALYASGDPVSFQVPVFGEPSSTTDKQFTTLRPAAPNTLIGDWVTSRAIGDAFAAGDQAPLAALQAALNADEPLQILAFGVFVDANTTATLHTIVWNDNTYFFAPAPVFTVAPETVTVADATAEDKGVTATASGFAAGEEIIVGLGNGGGGGQVDTVFADEAGNVEASYFFTGGDPALGQYTLSLNGTVSGFRAFATFTVVANATPAATLPDTGVDAGGIALLAGVMLLAGAGVFALRRRTAVQ